MGLAAMKRRILTLGSIALLCLTRSASAQEPAYVDDLRFVDKLREGGDTDLALELLKRLEAIGSPQLRNELPFQYALCHKAEAINETDSGKRLALYAKARTDLVTFRDANPNHPRLAETKIDIADITVLEGKTQMSRAMALDGIEAQSAELLKARSKFEAAAGELKAITEELEGKIKALEDPKTPAEKAARTKLGRTRVRAELSVAINLFDIAQTYHRDSRDNNVLIERGRKVTDARQALEKVKEYDESNSEVWQAKAWLGRCEQELGKPKTARDLFIPIIKDRSAPAADGRRLARYFRLLVIQELLPNGQAEMGESTNTLIESARDWIHDYPRSLATPEGFGIRFLLADSVLTMAGAKETTTAKKTEYQNEARKLLDALVQSENEFTDRARRAKIRLTGLSGGFTKPVAQLATFDDCYVRAQYEMMEMGEDARKLKGPELEAKRADRTKTVLAALERGLGLPDPKAKTGNEANNAKAMLSFFYLTSRKYPDSIRVGRTFAEADPRSSQAALAAAYALQAYGASIAERETKLQKPPELAGEFTDNSGTKIDAAAYRKLLDEERGQMLIFAAYCEKNWSKDLAGNLARHQIGMMQIRNEKLVEAIKVLNSITSEYPSFSSVQYLIADESLKAHTAKVDPFADAAKGETAPVAWFERGMTALRNISEGSGAADQNRLFYQARTRLSLELYREKKYVEIETLVAPLLKKVADTTFHDDAKVNEDIRVHYRAQLNKARLLSRVGLADVDFKAGQFEKVAAIVDPVLTDLKNDVIPPGKSDPLIGQALQALLSMGLQANVQLGKLDKVKLVVEVYGKAVGEDPAAVAVPEVLKRLVPIIRTQIDKAKSDPAALDRAVAAFTSILDDLHRQQKKQPPPPEFLLVMSQCYGSMKKSEEALKMLKSITKPRDDDMEGQRIYQSSCLVRMRLLRQMAEKDSKNKEAYVKEASDLLNECMGTKEKPGWGAKSIEAHMERMYLYELEGQTGAGFNKAQDLVKVLSAKGVNPNTLNYYLECCYYEVYFLNENGKNLLPQRTGADRIAKAAGLIIDLEGKYKDYGTPEMEAKFKKLINYDKNTELRNAYQAARNIKK